MIKENNLRNFRPDVQYTNAQGLTLQTLQNLLKQKVNEYQLEIDFYYDQIKGSALINPPITDCIVMYHPRHKKDYFNIVISIRRRGNISIVSCNDIGTSKNRYSLGNPNLKSGGSRSSLVIDIIDSITGKNRQIQEEEDWYAGVNLILDDIIS